MTTRRMVRGQADATDCRSVTGVTVGLVDCLISVARVLTQRDLTHPAVLEALTDLRSDEDVKTLLESPQCTACRRGANDCAHFVAR